MIKNPQGESFPVFQQLFNHKNKASNRFRFPQTEGTNTTSAVIFSKMDYHIINKIKSRKKDNFSQSLATKD